ncbi:MAG: DUF4926 domain-containing protein [Hyphomonadaceae bacterium]|nr:MAG: hypothetical protein FD160_3823 [Caulobacteraceae bacterium]MBT9447138.1 DUF4926 domain-containing protein [Hyphomonadaceae bacterium]TPW05833.1 MAG: hypothetical protein FD124_2002 [Alphaproteobacteria bacterium]
MDKRPQLLDVVALVRDRPDLGLRRGQVGAVVDDAGGDLLLVEFADANGEAFAVPALPANDVLVLRFEPAA